METIQLYKNIHVYVYFPETVPFSQLEILLSVIIHLVLSQALVSWAVLYICPNVLLLRPPCVTFQ